MNRTLQLRSWLALGASTAALLAGAPAFAQASGAAAQSTTIGEIVVTAQRKSEALQSVPLAVSAFSQDSLKVQRLDGGQNLELSVPNVNYSRSNFGGYNFQIRGVGTKVVSPTGDPGVSFNINELPVAANHLGDTDFYDVDRVEVLRGPQGTLYGRNATGGAVNVIYAQPNDVFSSSFTGDYGNYDSKKVSGYVNLPFGDNFSARIAGFYFDRGGFGVNEYNGDKIDNRHLGSGRITLAWHPTDKFKSVLSYEHFAENDNRNRVGKQLCHSDPGNAAVAAYAGPYAAYDQGLTSQGCSPGSLYGSGAYGNVNSQGTLTGVLGGLIGLTSGNVFANNANQNTNLHDIDSTVDPTYKAEENLFIWKNTYEINDNLELSSITGFNKNTYSSVEDYNRIIPDIAFNTGNPFFPGGVVQDPQVGTSNFLRNYDYSASTAQEITEELRLSSSFKGPLNFSVGAEYIDDKGTDDYDVESNLLTAFAQESNTILDLYYGGGASPSAACTAANSNPFGNCRQIPISGSPSPQSGLGHNYYDARFTTTLKSAAAFGEVYYQIAPDLKLTGGLRYTQDQKTSVYYPIELLADTGVPGFGSNLTNESATFSAVTGRVNLEWSPQLSFTNHSMFYGSYSRGYQGGGFNTPCAAVTGCASGSTFAPEYIDSFEVGTKNTAFNGSVMLNLTGFYYVETGYQISQIINKSSVNSNINASLYGLELESLWAPVKNLTFNANVGYLHTRITSGDAIDQLNITDGNPALQLLKASDGSNCVVSTTGLIQLETIQSATAGSPYYVPGVSGGATDLLGACNGKLFALGGGGIPALYNYSGINNMSYGTVANAAGTGCQTLKNGNCEQVGLGINQSLVGRQLPNSPDFTVSIGGQYVWRTDNWKVTARADYYWQDSSYARIFNDQSDFLQSWSNTNASLNFERKDWGLTVQLYIKNIFNAQPITDAYLTDASSGLFQNVFTLDPRTYGISLTKKFN